MAAHPPTPRFTARGFSLTEILVVIHVVGVLAAIAINLMGGAVDRARVARRADELRGLQAAMWSASDNGLAFPDPSDFWTHHAGSLAAGPFALLVAGGPERGGTALDPGRAEGAGGTGGGSSRRPVSFVIVCDDDFGDQAEYIYIQDHGPPTIVTGPENDPGYRDFETWNADDKDGDSSGASGAAASASGGGGAGGSSSQTMMGWAGSKHTRTDKATEDWLSEMRSTLNEDSEHSQQQAPSRGGGRSTNSRIGG